MDTSNPFIARDIPTPDESFVIIRFKDPHKLEKLDITFPYLLSMIHDSFMTRRNTMVVPGGKMGMAMEIILEPIITRMMAAPSGLAPPFVSPHCPVQSQDRRPQAAGPVIPPNYSNPASSTRPP